MNNFELAKQYFLEGCDFLESEKYLLAEDKFKQSLALLPDRASTLTNLSATQFKLKKYSEAKTAAEKAIFIEGGNSEAYLNLGLIEKEFKQFESSIILFDKAITLNSHYHEAWSNKGNVLSELKRHNEAIAHFDKALSLKPDYVEAWSNKGATLHALKRYDEAIAHYDKALSLNPDYVEAWSNKGVTLHELNRYDEAIAHYDKALSLNPGYAEASLNKGNTFNKLKRYDQVITCYDKALRLKPDIDWIYGYLLHAKMKVCLWTDLDNSLETISKKIAAKEKAAFPFALLTANDDACLHKQAAQIFSNNKYPVNQSLGAIEKISNKKKIRIGYFSPDFKNHPVSLLTAELFELHNKDHFEIFAFSFGLDDQSPMRHRLSQAFNQFIDVSEMSDIEIASLSRELQIDIAVDLCGYTADNRTGIFAYRAAPIQVSYIGYLGTMGADYMDYLIADKTIVPSGSEPFYSEKIAYLPSYQVNDRKRVISDRIFTREELGLPENGFVYCCFNNNYKILPNVLDGWARILKAVDDSVLFLYADNEWAQNNLQKEIEARGIDGARLVFGKRIAIEDYLARYRACDLFLDTFPYNAGTTASDALWVGLPVLTLAGKSFASRVAASLLNAIGLPELITNNSDEYESMAIELAKNPQKLQSIKRNLENNRSRMPLFDTPLFAKNLEAAYTEMYRRYQADLQPYHILIDS